MKKGNQKRKLNKCKEENSSINKSNVIIIKQKDEENTGSVRM